MKRISPTKFQISASVDEETVNAITKIIGVENRKFSVMVNILLAEAVKARNGAESGLKSHSKKKPLNNGKQ